jgi:hypothetical protein
VALTGSPAGGVWSGAHVTGSTFDATGISAGSYTVTYTYTDTQGCSNFTDATVTVNALPVVTADPKSVCIGSTVALTSSPAGGVWSGAHITGSTFDATGLSAGPYTVTYTFTNLETGCVNHADATVTVNALPVVIADPKSVCIGSTVALTGSPAGGVWSGAHVTGSTFDATGISAGSYTVTYTFTNLDTGCVNHADATVTVQSCAQEGCTLGYWKNHTDRWCGAYRTCDLFGSVFANAPSNLANLTLLEALNLGGGGIYNLARQGLAALLNACSDQIDYAGYSDNPSLIINAVNTAYRTGGNAPGLLGSKLDVLNNSGCPLGGTKATSMSNCIEKTSSTIGFETYPVPFKDYLTIKYKFDYSSDVKIEIFNSNGVLILSKNDTNGYFDKEITLNFNSNNKRFYLVKVTTNRESIIKKVLSSK